MSGCFVCGDGCVATVPDVRWAAPSQSEFKSKAVTGFVWCEVL